MRLFWKTSQNVSAYKRQVQPSWISNCFKKIQHLFRNPIETCVVSLVPGHALILRKKLKMWKVYDIWANWWMDGCQTLFDRVLYLFEAIRNPRWLHLSLIGWDILTCFPKQPHMKTPDLPEMFLKGLWRSVVTFLSDSNSKMAIQASDWLLFQKKLHAK
jgi:hypothetical protein